MASISTGSNGRRTIQFVAGDGKRRSIRLGKYPMKAAKQVCTRVEALNAAAISRTSIDNETAEWVGSIDDVLYDKLVAVGLVPKRVPVGHANLEGFIDQHVKSRVNVKPATKEIWKQGKRGLIDFLGAATPIRDVSPGDADKYKMHLEAAKLAPMTIRKRVQFAKMIFRAAVRNRVIRENPFDDVKVEAVMPERTRVVTPEETAAILEACPDHNWRVIVALARWGGLRCPSEVLSLRWQDIDWSGERIIVQSPKTEHHPGKATRRIPLFAELRPWLEQAFELAPEGAVYVVDERFRKASNTAAGWRNCNLRTTFEKIVKRAGLATWERLFHTLRASRQTELAERLPAHVVCAWLGNSEDVARAHYLKVTDEHFAKAIGNPVEKAVHKAVQFGAERVRNTSQQGWAAQEKSPEMPGETACCEGMRESKADGEGFEPPVSFRPRRFSRPVP